MVSALGAARRASAAAATVAASVGLGARAEAFEQQNSCSGLPLLVHLADGLDSPPVLIHTPGKITGSQARCAVAWLPHEELEEPGMLEAALTGFDFVLTDSLEVVPFAARSLDGRTVFLERAETHRDAEPDEMLASKEHLLSVLLPRRPSKVWADPQVAAIAEQAERQMPDDTYVDDGSADLHRRAFEKYRFSLIVDDEAHTVSPAFVRCFAWGTAPLFNGFATLSTMMLRTIAPFNRSYFGLDYIRSYLQDVNWGMGYLWQQHRMLQDQLAYRYNRPFRERLEAVACTLCRLSRSASEASLLPAATSIQGGGVEGSSAGRVSAPAPTLAFVGVYSAKVNFEKRMAVRQTWGRIFTEVFGSRPRFFLGAFSSLPSLEDLRARRESEEYGDIVALDIAEGYKFNARKGLLFLEWIAANVEAEFLLKVDDDVYVRPGPVLATLRRRPPFGYIWGYFDYMSPLPHNSSDPFYNHPDDYPFPTFPPYPRGLLRAMSMDVVRHLAHASHRRILRLIFGDDPCLGVHLRQVLLDSEQPLPLLQMDDRDSYRTFAMEPSCSPKLWSHVTPRSWVVHHVTAEQIRCMFRADQEAGYYIRGADGRISLSADAQAAAELAATVSTARHGEAPQVPPMPELCSCLEEGPLAAALAAREDKINASHTYRMWGDPNSELDDME